MTQNSNGTTQGSGQICAEEYVVKRGDSFYLIAHKLGVPLRDLLAANREIHPARLMVGDVLCIPREEDDAPAEDDGSATEPADEPTTDKPTTSDSDTAGSGAAKPDLADDETDCADADRVTVESGQTVADIQLSHLVSRHTLDTANPKVNLDSIKQGQVLCVPMENVPCALPATYILGAGETLDSVAVRFNLPIGTLLRANPCLAPQDFEEGASVILPK